MSLTTVAVQDKSIQERHKTEKRQYFRQKRQNYRQRERDEIEWLRSQVAGLEIQARGLQAVAPRRQQPNRHNEWQLRDLALSWRDIAAQLKREYRLTVSEHDDLLERVQTQAELNQAMAQFVIQAERIPVSLSTPFRLQYVALSAHPVHRKHSKEWATQQLYHNMPVVFQDFPIASSNGDATAFKLDVRDMCVNVKDYSQYIWPAPLEMVRFMLRHHLEEMSSGQQIEAIEWTENTVLYQVQAMPAQSTSVRVLQAQFHEAGRSVLVVRQVEADELSEVPLRPIYNVMWMDLQQLPDGRTLGRTASFVSTNLVDSGISLDEYAKRYGVDVSQSREDDKVQILQNALAKWLEEHEERFRERVNTLVDKIRNNFMLQ
ncbi:unnamed protein product [Aphanomyces euteiches]|uniref:START domain-containing protein n=1 Tax=Aphanomyces euteiches TaxID=100861 RepID=A0A6G0WUQ5_9STRA|nr:hypothetical protein Ae201684_011458 [Aphanomyces euteiches]KAH9097170.1 hypothetical protein Ae201684P_011894 [Aphanomyces euteiches]KAH9154495.1 hypothetical protein AeRB84_003418 [Aphanomyces euteiches]